jgi:hypothetical protein
MNWSGESSAEVSASSFYGHIQQTNASITKSLGDAISVSHVIFCAIGTDVKVGDRLNDYSKYYAVKAITDYQTGDNAHREVFVEREEDYASV